MGALTLSGLKWESAGSQKKVIGKVAFSADYATGGESLTVSQLGLCNLSDLMIEDSSGYAFDLVNNNPTTVALIKAFMGTGGGAIGNESAHTHAAGAITITPNAVTAGTPAGSVSAPSVTSNSAGTPAGSVAAPVLTMDSYTPAGSVAAPVVTMDSYTPAGSVAAPTITMDSYTPVGSVAAPSVTSNSAGTPAGTNAASAVSASYLPDYTGIVKPAIKLTYDADPSGVGLAAAALYIVEALDGAAQNCATLQSTCASATSVLGETADGSVYLAASSARFFVTHKASPSGVQVYVNEASSYQLEFISPTATDAVILMPMENAGLGAPFIKVTVHHSATADSGKALYFDDNGAADAQLCFVATDAADHAVPPSDIVVATAGASLGVDGSAGTATGQTFTGSALGDHTHTSGAPAFTGTPAVLTGANSAPAFTGTPAVLTGANSAPAFTGTPAILTGANSAPAFTGSVLADHTHTAGVPAFIGSALSAHQHADTASGAATGAGSAHTHSGTMGTAAEVPAHTDLSALVVDFVAYGY